MSLFCVEDWVGCARASGYGVGAREIDRGLFKIELPG